MQDEYRPSSASLLAPPDERPRSTLVAILLGGLVVDVLGSILAGGVIASAWAILAMRGADASTDPQAMTSSSLFLALLTLFGLLLIVAGGYTAAWWARRRPVAHALGAGSLSLAFGIAIAFTQRDDAAPAWLNLASFSLHLPLAASGGYLFARSRRPS